MAESQKPTKPAERVHFFISHTGADLHWAEWIGWQLEDAGYRVILDAWDFQVGTSFVRAMEDAASRAERTLVVASPDYFQARYTTPEWEAAFTQDGLGQGGAILPVIVKACTLPMLLRRLIYIDLVDLDADAAKAQLLSRISPGRGKPQSEPAFPGEVADAAQRRPEPYFPGALPPNVDAMPSITETTQCYLSVEADTVPSGTAATSPSHVPQAPRQSSDAAPATRRSGKKGMTIAVSALGLLLIGAAVVYMTWNPLTVPESTELPAAYEALKQGDWPKAETLFQRLQDQDDPQIQAQSYAGLAAVKLHQGYKDPALSLATQAEGLDPYIVYSHVIRGNVMWQRDKLSQAESAYRQALDKPNGKDWQKAEAANRLGRIYAFRGQTTKALEQYDKAIELAPQMAVAFANKGHLKAQRNLHQEAIEQYKKASAADPADKLSKALLRASKQQWEFQQDRDRSQRVHNQMLELMAKFPSGKVSKGLESTWDSKPFTLLLLPLQRQGPLAVRADEETFLQYRIEQVLRDSGRVELIPPELFQTFLTVSKINPSDLAEPSAAKGPGRVLQARHLLSGHFTRRGEVGHLSLTLREIDSDTTLEAGALQATSLDEIATKGAHNLLKELRRNYLLQGHIEQVGNQGVILNIGRAHGVTHRLTFEVLGGLPSGDGDGTSAQATSVGRIQVTTVKAQQSTAKVLQQNQPFQQAWKVREVHQP